jgi:GH24 family phage-related lysozyme (muramidase)
MRNPSQKALDLILKYEVGGGKSYYEKHLTKPEWPGGASGFTLGIGVDCGYYKSTELEKLFNFLPKDQLEIVKGASGKTGQAGKKYTLDHRNSGITVSWDHAVEMFDNLIWPKFATLAERAFPDLTKLHPDAYGAIVSLVFNRGTAMKGDSRQEMRVIKMLIPDKKYKEIAAQFRKMKRLWVGKGLDGLLERRDAEAKLIESCS